ncbi:MAG: 50S ribosomal protein L4 [Clostridiales bacterium]|jgi:large subunit ribosomal protein L4|nr:50S ribosomal protein L4 [Clostridiales bacterium]OPZ68928.1 MAG: 50S ribosomal protein L4 [Firmicutes bacterium ADurb.Bin467]
MPNVKVFNMQGAQVGEMELADDVFGAEVHVSAMHTVVRAILNAKRQGTQSARTRTEVRGGGRKIYRQKGTGNARHHGRRAPQFTHGGVVFAPKPRSYRVCVPKSIRRLAMKSALTCKVNDNELVVLDKLELQEAKTKLVAKMLKALGAEKKALIVTRDPESTIVRAANNIPNVKVTHVGTLNVVDILDCDKFIIAEDAVKQVEEVYAQ